MLKYIYSFILLGVLCSPNLYGQNPYRQKREKKELQYCINHTYGLYYTLFVEKKANSASFSYIDSPENLTLDSLVRLLHLPDYDWLYRTVLTNKPSPPMLRLFCNETQGNMYEPDSITLSKEQSIYTSQGHLLPHTGDMFRIVYDSVLKKYDDRPYKCHFISATSMERCVKLDRVKHITGSDFSVFYYKVRKEGDFGYVTIGFVPQIGIISYDYTETDVHIILEMIDNKPLDYYLNHNICITPFCDIK